MKADTAAIILPVPDESYCFMKVNVLQLWLTGLSAHFLYNFQFRSGPCFVSVC